MDTHFSGTSQQSDRTGKPKTSTKQLQLHVASVYCQIAQMIKQRCDLQIEMPAEVPTAVQRVNLIKSVLAYLLDQPHTVNNNKSHKVVNQLQQNEQNDIECVNCQNYEKNLQKLQSQIRNHIRTHQQLKLYQDGLEQKIEQHKKQKKQMQKKYESVKKKYQQVKMTITSNSQKSIKMQQQNERLRNQIRQLKQQPTRIQEGKRPLTRYQSNKQNLSEWRNSNFNERERERSSLQKRPESTERMRVSVNVRSTKGIPISSKIVQQKAKQEKAKALKNRLGF